MIALTARASADVSDRIKAFESATSRTNAAPLIAHVIHRLGVGGLENGLVNVINGMPERLCRHAIVCLDGSTPFSRRITRQDVPIISLHKRPGKDVDVYRRLWRTLRELGPAIVHTRNLPAIELPVVAALAGVPGRVHSEHGHDVGDPTGSRPRYRLVRRAVRPWVHRYVAVSDDLTRWLRRSVGASVRCIYNGVDSTTFHPATRPDRIGPNGFAGPDAFVVGTVGRLAAVKQPTLLIRAFATLLARDSSLRKRMRLVIVGDGPLARECRDLVSSHGIAAECWIAGERDDVPALLRGLDLFVLPSATEGMSNTILEAMATGLPVVATRVGGNPELVVDGVTGSLVPAGDGAAMASAMQAYAAAPHVAREHGRAGRERIETQFSLTAMVAGYCNLYAEVLQEIGVIPARGSS